MARLLLLLPVCLYLQDGRCGPCDLEEEPAHPVAIKSENLPVTARPGLELVAGFSGSPVTPFPANLPWEPLREISLRHQQAVEKILRADPPRFLQMCVERYDREVQGYSGILQKRERVAGQLHDTEVVAFHFRERPFSVSMNWKKGARRAQKTLYVEGENHNKMLARPAGFLAFVGVVERDVDSPDVKAAGRYTVTEFGMQLGTLRTLKPMIEAKARKALHVRYEGMFRVPEAGDRPCYKLVRTPYDPPEDEGVNELTIYLDAENWFQVGSVLKGADGQLIAEYYFRDLRLNPSFEPNPFTRAGL